MALVKAVRSKASSSPGVTTPDSGTGRKPKQAVVVIHGMGEQRPMETLRGFVEAVWLQDTSLAGGRRDGASTWVSPPAIWIVPDAVTGSHEQRRITTSYDANGRRTDFFELYWADLTQGTTRERLYAWLASLLLRRRADIPVDARRLYRATLLFVLLTGALSLVLAFSFWKDWLGATAAIATILIATLFFWALDRFILPYFGDVASYVRAEAATVEKRALVRERGLGLMRRLMEDDRYDRIVLVSHSLGSIIAYDLLQILWSEYRPQNLRFDRDKPLWRTIKEAERFARLPEQPVSTMEPDVMAAFRRAQWSLYEQSRTVDPRLGKGWKISDFVTLGSPLTHAEFLMTHNRAELTDGIAERLFSTCPPIADSASKPLLYESGRDPDGDRPLHSIHHGAVFAATRWSNMFDLGNLLTTGDPISGSMRENFGSGVREVQVEMRRKVLGRFTRLFTHTAYWSLQARGTREGSPSTNDMEHIRALRDAVDLARARGGSV